LARESYQKVLAYFAAEKHPLAPRQYALFLSELAYAEALYGDWTCAEKLRGEADNALQLIRFRDSTVSPYYDMFIQNFSTVKQHDGQKSLGCGYELAEIKF